GRNLLGAGQGNEQTMEIATGAVAALTGPHRIPLPPADSLLAIAHMMINEVVEHPSGSYLIARQSLALEQLERLALDRHLGVGLEKAGQCLALFADLGEIRFHFTPGHPIRHSQRHSAI